MKILMVYPQYPDTFWSFKHALSFISKKAAFPPLGLLTVAAMLPGQWEVRLIDMNVAHLHDRDLRWADYVFISAMSVQGESVWSVIKRCQRLGVKTVAGGPYFTMQPEIFEGQVDHLVLNEAEVTLPPFIADIQSGTPKPLYQTSEWPSIESTPPPRWDLLDINKYSSVCVQYSRGCPFDCEFCDIVVLNGHKPRTKSAAQLIGDLKGLHKLGWKNSVFIVDDNFIGNKRKLKDKTLPALIEWMDSIKHPFSFVTEASVNLADDEELMRLMVEAGFDTVFVGIETPNDESLNECGKMQNRNRNLVDAVHIMHNHGLQVHGGFIVGFDSDPISIFENQINFIQKSGIVTAMVGLLNAPHGTKLYNRLKRENRLINDFTGNNTDCSMNFVPKMNPETLIKGYRRILDTIYSPKEYYERITTFFDQYKPLSKKGFVPQYEYVCAFIKSLWVLGIRDKGRRYYWKLLAWTIWKRPRCFPLYITMAIYGFHFRKVVQGFKPLAFNGNIQA